MKKQENFYPGDIPAKPGVYIFRDKFGKVIYVGKATNLRRRMTQYFQPSRRRRSNAKGRSLINSIYSWEYKTVKNESESLVLESRLIKKYVPYYNTLMRDDKRYLLVKINPNEPFPKLMLARLRKRDGAQYYGPFPQGNALKATIDFLNKYFQLRFCKTFTPDEEDRKHCIEGRVKYCCEPCVGKVSKTEYIEKVNSLIKVLKGNIKEVVNKLEKEMKNFSENKNFEKAALRRDMIQNINEIFGTKNRNFRYTSINNSPGSTAINELQSALGLKKSPELIEAFDISNLGEDFAVGSMICFVNGTPAKKKYKKFKIKSVEGRDDFAMMQEVIKRHFNRKIREEKPLPDLAILDGGKGQLSSVLKILREENIPPFPIIALAKRQEEIFLPGTKEPIILNKYASALKLLQSIRDEAHRFAISYNRDLRLKKINESVLDDIPGIGKERKKEILKNFKSIKELADSSPEKIAEKVPNIGLKFARNLSEYLSSIY